MQTDSRDIILAPSVLSANFARLEEDIRKVEHAGARLLHLDVMDGHFVPNISFGPMIVKTIRQMTSIPLDTHLMIDNPERYLEVFRDAGTDSLTVHIEVCKQRTPQVLKKIRELGMKSGVSLNPDTHADELNDALPFADAVLVMSVQPGFGGQQFQSKMLEKIKYLKYRFSSQKYPARIAVDGGLNKDNVADVVTAGADIIVAGNAIFGTPDPVRAFGEIQNILVARKGDQA